MVPHPGSCRGRIPDNRFDWVVVVVRVGGRVGTVTHMGVPRNMMDSHSDMNSICPFTCRRLL